MNFSKQVKILMLFLIMMLFPVSVIGPSIGSADQTTIESIDQTSSDPYRKSDSPLLRLPQDRGDWQPAMPPEPRLLGETEDPGTITVYTVTSGETTTLPYVDSGKSSESSSNTTPPFEGLLPPGIVAESVYLPDDRLKIPDTGSYPWRTIVKLFITFPDNSQLIGSGSIIGSSSGHGYHVLTAAHCVYRDGNGGWATSIEVIPGLDQSYMPYNHAWMTNAWVYTAWIVSAPREHDFAVVTLDRNVGDYTGWMGRMTSSYWDPVYTGILNIAGYPGDLSSGLSMYYDSDYGRTATEYLHWYYMDTFGGQSGSPVWVYSGDRYITTVHTLGNDGTGSNSGTRINQDKFDDINGMTSEDPPPTDYADLIDDGQTYSGFSPTTVEPCVTYFSVENDVRNIGTASSGGFYVSYYASTNQSITPSDYLIGTVYVPSISPFEWEDSGWSGTFPSGIPAGTYWIGWIIDSGDDVVEFDGTNNVAFKDSYTLNVISHSGSCESLDYKTDAGGRAWVSGTYLVGAKVSETWSDGPTGDQFTFSTSFTPTAESVSMTLGSGDKLLLIGTSQLWNSNPSIGSSISISRDGTLISGDMYAVGASLAHRHLATAAATDSPGAGTYTYTLDFKTDPGGQTWVSGTYLLAVKITDRESDGPTGDQSTLSTSFTPTAESVTVTLGSGDKLLLIGTSQLWNSNPSIGSSIAISRTGSGIISGDMYSVGASLGHRHLATAVALDSPGSGTYTYTLDFKTDPAGRAWVSGTYLLAVKISDSWSDGPTGDQSISSISFTATAESISPALGSGDKVLLIGTSQIWNSNPSIGSSISISRDGSSISGDMYSVGSSLAHRHLATATAIFTEP
jgi:V8-like Glu-specific endopeptidase